MTKKCFGEKNYEKITSNQEDKDFQDSVCRFEMVESFVEKIFQYYKS